MKLLKYSRLIAEEKGITLAEVMLAAGVLLITVVYMLGSLAGVSGTTDTISTRAVATAHISSVMEQVQGQNFTDLMTFRPPELAGLGVSETVQVACIDEDGQAISLPIEDEEVAAALPNPLEVRVTVTWHDNQGRACVRRASTMIGK